MIFVLTGNGKGKTTSAIGMGVRAAGAAERILMVQFLKTGDSSENKVIKKIKNFKIESFGRLNFGPYTEKDLLLTRKGLDFLKNEVKTKRYDLIILDEINVAIYFGLIDRKEVLDFLKKYGGELDIVLTGRHCPKEIVKIADLVTEMKEVKHYYKIGGKAKKGIEY